MNMYSLKEGSTKPVYKITSLFEAGICDINISQKGNLIAATSKEGYQIKLVDIRMDKVLMSL